jgi:hypothetical protein
LGIAGDRSCSSTAALLRQAFTISAADAAARVKAAAQILPRETMTGGTAAPLLPELAEAVDGGCIGPEHVKIIVETMAKVPANVDPADRDLCEQTLVDTAMDCDPNFLGNAAQRILDRVDPDGTIDDTTPASKMEFHLGTRSTRTGLTPIKGQLDDHGVEVVKKAIDAPSAPGPTARGTPTATPCRIRGPRATGGPTASSKPCTGCDRPPDWCDGHHIEFWRRDFGNTSYGNGCLLCPHHHTEIHKLEWVIRMAADGTPEFIPPKWLDPAQRPRRNTLRKFDVIRS